MSKAYQDMIIDFGASDIVYTAAVSANFLVPCLNTMAIKEEILVKKEKLDFREDLTAKKRRSVSLSYSSVCKTRCNNDWGFIKCK